MKTLLKTMIAVVFLVAPMAYAEETDDVFLDDGGVFDEVPPEPGPESAETHEVPTDSGGTTTAIDDAFLDEPIGEEQEEMPEAVPQPTKVKPAKVVKAVKPAPKKVAAAKKKAVAKHTGAKGRKLASKGLFRTTSGGGCKMHRSPASSSPVLTTVEGSKKLWVEEQSGGWYKAFRKKGHGYLSGKCFK